MLFKKPENKDKVAENVTVATPAERFPNIKEEDIHIMPGKFVAMRPPAAKRNAKSMAAILLSLFIFLLLLLGGAAWYIKKKSAPPVNSNQSQNNNTSQANTNNDNQNQNLNNSNIDNVNTNTNNDNQNINNNTNVIVPPPSDTLDADNDGLTLTEESLYKTNPQIADTDKDGYTDGQELINLYNPLVANQALAGSALVKTYHNEPFDYQLLIPTSWVVQTVDDTKRHINFVPDAATGELVTVNVLDNTQHLELTDWQKTLYAGQTLDNFRLASRPALITSDGRQVLLATYDYVITIIYDVPTQSVSNFKATFNMMLKSFKLPELVKPPQTNG